MSLTTISQSLTLYYIIKQTQTVNCSKPKRTLYLLLTPLSLLLTWMPSIILHCFHVKQQVNIHKIQSTSQLLALILCFTDWSTIGGRIANELSAFNTNPSAIIGLFESLALPQTFTSTMFWWVILDDNLTHIKKLFYILGEQRHGLYPDRTEACHNQWQDSASPSAGQNFGQHVSRVVSQGSKENNTNKELVEMVRCTNQC